MTVNHTPNPRPTLWIVVGAALAVLGAAILWPLQQVGQVCVLIYPAPPGCGAEEPRWVPLAGIGLLVALLAAQIIVFFTSTRPRVPLIALAGAMLIVIALAVAVVQLSQTGIWDPAQPPVIID